MRVGCTRIFATVAEAIGSNDKLTARHDERCEEDFCALHQNLPPMPADLSPIQVATADLGELNAFRIQRFDISFAEEFQERP